MPYHIIKVQQGYYVVKDDGTRMSHNPIPLERAKAQMKALYMAMKRE